MASNSEQLRLDRYIETHLADVEPDESAVVDAVPGRQLVSERMASTAKRWIRTLPALAALAVVAGLAVPTASASPPNTVYLVSNVGRHVQLNYAAVTLVDRAGKSLDVVRKNNSTVFTILYSATTVFYGSRLSAIKVGTVLTVAGVLTGTTLRAQQISTRLAPTGAASGSIGSSTGPSGPFSGLKYVGNV